MIDINNVILAPIFEELVFRGLILRQMLKRYSPMSAILLSSVLFGFIHMDPSQFVYQLMMGGIFGLLYFATKSLTVSTLAHILGNLVAVLFQYQMINITMRNAVPITFVYVMAFGLMLVLFRNRLKDMTWKDWIRVGDKPLVTSEGQT